MQFVLSLITLGLTSAQFFGGLGGMGMGMGGYDMMGGMGYGGMGYGGMGYGGMGYGGMGMGGMGYGGMGFLCGSSLSDEDLDELCDGCCYPDGCCYELCDGCCYPDGCCYELCGFEGQNGMGSFGGCGGCGFQCPQIQCPVYRQPQQFDRSSSMSRGNIAGYANGNCANAYGAGNRNCGYNQGAVCGSAAHGHMNADACRRNGNRAFSRKNADEMMIRRSNEACEFGDDHYGQAHANICGGGGRIAGNRACGNAHACHSNAAGLRSSNRGVCGNAGCCRNNVHGCGSMC